MASGRLAPDAPGTSRHSGFVDRPGGTGPPRIADDRADHAHRRRRERHHVGAAAGCDPRGPQLWRHGHHRSRGSDTRPHPALVYLDAFLPVSGEAALDLADSIGATYMRANIRDGFIVPAPVADESAIPRDVPQPLRTFTDTLRLYHDSQQSPRSLHSDCRAGKDPGSVPAFCRPRGGQRLASVPDGCGPRAGTFRPRRSRQNPGAGPLTGMTHSSSLADALRDRYRIERELGRGGMATVYLAHDLKHDRPVALKVLRPELARRARPRAVPARDPARRPARSIPTSCRCSTRARPPGSSGSRMPYVEGESLRERLGRERPAPARRGGPDRPRGGRRAGLRPPARRDPPRHQAGEHPAHRGRRRWWPTSASRRRRRARRRERLDRDRPRRSARRRT